MNRYLFRGKSKDGWVFGLPSYDTNGNITEIESFDEEEGSMFHEVDPATIGQFTGEKYKNVKLFKGDIVEIEFYPDSPTTAGKELITRLECKWFGGHSCGFMLERICGETDNFGCNTYSVIFSGGAVKRKTIIGNRWDNPELLEQKESPCANMDS